MILALACAAMLGGAPRDPWPGADKAKHFLLSAFVHSATFSASRLVTSRANAQAAGGAAVLAAGIFKEWRDRGAGRHFSVADIVAGAAGGVAAAALLNGTR